MKFRFVFYFKEIFKVKKITKTLFLLLSLQLTFIYAKRTIVNEIVVRVNGVNILKSDLQMPRIGNNGKPYPLEALINEELMFQKAAEKKLLPTKLEVEKQIVSLKAANNLQHLSDEQFDAELQKEGFSLNDYKLQLARILAGEKLKQVEINEKVIVTSQEVENYYNNNPEYTKESYWIKLAIIPEKSIKDGKAVIKKSELQWDDLGWISRKDMSQNLTFVFKMKKNQISKPIKISDRYQLIKLVDKQAKKLKSLDERYIKIEKKLLFKKRSDLEKELQSKIRDKSTIVYF